jgi:hypothetical protein
MSSFLVPCISMIVVFWLGFGLTYFVLRGRVTRLERRVGRLERQGGRTTENFPLQQQRPPTRPRPVTTAHYISVDRQPKY